ncbi:MAG: integrase, partial [Burkholderiales bacterium]|nr:integrase [Burkholderiales bacterium]
MTRGRLARELDLNSWAEFDANALPTAKRKVFSSRRLAVELYVKRVPLTEIESQTGVDRRQLYRLLDRCVQVHEDGRVYGFRGLVRYARVADY